MIQSLSLTCHMSIQTVHRFTDKSHGIPVPVAKKKKNDVIISY